MLVRLSGKMVSGRLPNGLTDQDAVWARPRVGRRNRVLNGVRSPQRGPGAQPPEAENLLASGCATEAANLPHSVRTLSLSK